MRKLTFFTLAASAACLAYPASAQHSSSSSSSVSTSHSSSNVMVSHRGGHVFRPGFHPGPNFRHHRLRHGFFVHPFWFGPQFHVQNWQLYGFARPPRDHRWVRFYDDAYMIDRHGRVMDHRYDFDWDDYGERWGRRDGIPYYDGPHHDGPDDWADGPEEDWDDRDDVYVERHRRVVPPPPCHPGQPCAHHVQPYPGYGYGVVYPPIIIETTTTTTGCCEEVVEEVVEVRPRHRRHRPRAVRPRPRPRPGERG
jgi:Ni/Co efflux regulator RcnB